MKKIHKFLIISLLTGLVATSAKSQEAIDLILRPFQVTLFPPVGTNGFDSKDCVNKISLNVFWGVHAGLEGVEFGGFANIEREFVIGAQFAGFGNFNRGNLKGLSFSGFMNTASSVHGAQVTHFINIADEVQGAQVSNFMNVAGTVRGVQVGFLNIADNYESGVPLGIINIVKKGYKEWEISGSELWNLNVGYRMGVDKLYTQFMAGSNWKEENSFLGLGFGVGSRFGITRYFKASVDLISYRILSQSMNHDMNQGMRPGMNQGMHERQRATMLEQARLTFDGRILGHFRWFAGPTFNLLIAPYSYPEELITDHIKPKMIYSNTSGFSSVRMWLGCSGGIRF